MDSNPKKSQPMLHDGWDEYKNKRIYKPRGKIGLWRSIGYSSFYYYQTAIWTVTAYLAFFYTQFCGISPTGTAVIMVSGRIISTLMSLVIGKFSDSLYKYRIGRKYGRRHIFMLATVLYVLICPPLLWITGLNFWYYLLTHSVLLMFLATLNLPWYGLPNEMTNSFDKRTYMGTVRGIFGAVVGSASALIMGEILNSYKQNDPHVYLVAQIFFSVIAVVFILITYFTTWEHFVTKKEAARADQLQEKEDEANDGKLTQSTSSKPKSKKKFSHLMRDYLSTFKIKTFRKHFIYSTCETAGGNLAAVAMTYFIVSVLGLNASVLSFLNSYSIFAGIFIMLIAGYVIHKAAPRWVYAFTYLMCLVAAVGLGALGLIRPADATILLFVIQGFSVVGGQLYGFIPWTVFPSIPDLDTLLTGQERSGLFASVTGFGTELATALTNLIGNMLLQVAGFVSSATGPAAQPESAKLMIIGLVSVGPAIFFIIAFYAGFTFKLDKKRTDIVTAELSRLKAGGKKADASEEVKQVTKELTGKNYDEIKVWN